MADYGYHRAPPPIVAQPTYYDENGYRMISMSCWAAALSSWLKGTQGSDYSVANLLQIFRWYVTKNGLDISYFDRIADSGLVNMYYDFYDPSDLTFDYIYLQLQQSYLYLMSIPASGPAHVVVLYGVVRDRATGANEEIQIMDPLFGKLKRGSLSEYRKLADSFLVGWVKT